MTVEEKRKAIEKHCDKQGFCCTGCPLQIMHEKDGSCYSTVDDKKVERNYEILFGNKSEATSEDPVNLGDDLSVSTNLTSLKTTYQKYFKYEDPVNRPAHYTDGKIEVIDYIEDKKLGFCLGNAIKYISRAGKKDPEKEVEDLNKAIWYINRRIKEVQEVQNGSVRNYQKE